MFEDSTFESGGRIKSKSGSWMLLTCIIELSVLVLLILIPLIYPEALPKAAMQMRSGCSSPAAATAATAAAAGGSACGPRAVGDDEQSAHGADQAFRTTSRWLPRRKRRRLRLWRSRHGRSWRQLGQRVMGSVFGGTRSQGKGRRAARSSTSPGGVLQGMLLQKTMPMYPPIAKAARVSGHCGAAGHDLQDRNHRNLHVISGPAMLQQAALDAVQSPGATGPTCSTASRSKWKPQ